LRSHPNLSHLDHYDFQLVRVLNAIHSTLCPARAFLSSQLFVDGLLLPVVGTAWTALLGGGDKLHEAFHKASVKQNSPLIGGGIASYNIVVIHDAELLDELFIKNGSKTSARPFFDLNAAFSYVCSLVLRCRVPRMRVLSCVHLGSSGLEVGKAGPEDIGGILGASGEKWRYNRKLAFSKLFAKEKIKHFSGVIETELDLLSDYLRESARNGTVFDPTKVIPNLVRSPLKNYCSLSAGSRTVIR
jgi:hypothetical protein